VASAQISTPGQIAKQTELEKGYAKLQITDDWLGLEVPGQTVGETMGVSTNSQGHLFVYSRTNPRGNARGATAAMLWEFDENYKFVKEWGPNNYALGFAHSVRVDKDDNVWQLDEGSNMIIKYNTSGRPVFWLGRTLEAVDYLEEYLEHEGTGYYQSVDRIITAHPIGGMGEFNRPTDVTWDSKGNIFVSDGYNNSRVVKIAPDSTWVKVVGTFGNGVNQFHIPHSIACDNHDILYVGDRNNSRIQVYDTDLNYLRTYTGMGSPWGVSVNPGSEQYLFSGDGTTGKIYKMSLDGKMIGWAQTSLGHGANTTGRLIHQIHAQSANVVFLGSACHWDVQKITIHGVS
jgi:hypothetical protein